MQMKASLPILCLALLLTACLDEETRQSELKKFEYYSGVQNATAICIVKLKHEDEFESFAGSAADFNRRNSDFITKLAADILVSPPSQTEKNAFNAAALQYAYELIGSKHPTKRECMDFAKRLEKKELDL